MAIQTSTAELVEALYGVPGKAEIVGGEVVLMPPAGDSHNLSAGAIYVSLREYGRRTARGRAYSDNAGFLVDLPNRKSFSPDAAFYVGPRTGPKFLDHAPLFAVEVRSPEEYGPAAERALAAKRAEYFAAGTQVVWDVDILREGAIRVFGVTAPDDPRICRRGEVANAEPALPGWTFPVDDLFED
jgi:Uma2 family endonuclease